MPTPTYTALATTTLSGGETSVTFSSIPATYRDLVIQGTTKAGAEIALFIAFNADTTAANYSYVYMLGNGSTTSSVTSAANRLISSTSTVFSTFRVQAMDYSDTSKHKTYLSRADVSSAFTYALAGRWANTNAITSVAISVASNSFSAETTFSLFGIAS
jgi:hypothetical protein